MKIAGPDVWFIENDLQYVNHISRRLRLRLHVATAVLSLAVSDYLLSAAITGSSIKLASPALCQMRSVALM